jgi:hypothetical protein
MENSSLQAAAKTFATNSFEANVLNRAALATSEKKKKPAAAVANTKVLLDTIASYRPGFFALPG